ncbi:hypothetical protein [Candidatus Tisiphia endosymbiont of Hybos culiciformis]
MSSLQMQGSRFPPLLRMTTYNCFVVAKLLLTMTVNCHKAT